MPRSVEDATRFTATGPRAQPHRSARSSPYNRNGTEPTARPLPGTTASSSTPPRSNASGETPAQKVARLRAEHRARQNKQFTLWERVVLRGRSLADGAHRFTVMILLGLGVLTTGITAVSFVDMVRYNRKKMREFNLNQKILYQHRLREAKDALARGDANEDDIIVLENERQAVADDQKHKTQKRTLWTYIKQFFWIEGLHPPDQSATTSSMPKSPDEAEIEHVANTPSVLPAAASTTQLSPASSTGVLAALSRDRRSGERALEAHGVKGGPLDEMASAQSQRHDGKAESWWEGIRKR